MKKILSLALVCVLLVGAVMALASCSTLSGEYADKFGLVTLKFEGNNVNVKGLTGIDGGDYKYEISKDDDGNKKFNLLYTEGEKKGEVAFALDFTEGKDDDGSYIKIGIGLVSWTLYKK